MEENDCGIFPKNPEPKYRHPIHGDLYSLDQMKECAVDFHNSQIILMEKEMEISKMKKLIRFFDEFLTQERTLWLLLIVSIIGMGIAS